MRNASTRATTEAGLLAGSFVPLRVTATTSSLDPGLTEPIGFFLSETTKFTFRIGFLAISTSLERLVHSNTIVVTYLLDSCVTSESSL